MPQLKVPHARPRRGRARLGASVFAVAAVAGLAACGDDSDSAGPLDDTAAADVGGCELDTPAGGDDPGPAPEAPAAGETRAVLEEAIATTRDVSAAVAWQASSMELPQFRSGVEVHTALDTAGTGRVASEQWFGEDDEATIIACSDGGGAWLHVDHDSAEGDLPEDASWVAGERDEFVGAGIIVDLDQAWDALPVLRGMDDARDVGTGEVNGDEVRLLAGPVDYASAFAAAGEDEALALARTLIIATDEAMEEADVSAEVGIDGNGVVRSLEIDLTAIEPRADTGGTEDADGQAGGDVRIFFHLEVTEVNPIIDEPAAPAEDTTVPFDEAPRLIERLQAG